MSGRSIQSHFQTVIKEYPYEKLERQNAEETPWDLPRVDARGLPSGSLSAATAPEVSEDLERRLEQESRRSFEAGRQRGMEDGRAAERACRTPEDQLRAEQFRRLLDDVASGRDKYLQAVEHEIVRLALAVAGRILRREAPMDPLLLIGPVRVALGQVAAATEVQLHVPASDATLWSEAVALIPNPPVRPSIIADDSLHLGECRLQTNLGVADLGLQAQLGEIERKFFDHLTNDTADHVPSSKDAELLS